MKIAGVKGGPLRGEVIELSPMEKAAEAVKAGAIGHGPHQDFSVTLTNLNVKSVTASPLGAPLRGVFSNQSYEATASGSVWLRHKLQDKVVQPKLQSFSVKFHDELDSNGMPDLAIDSFTIDN